jgi:2-oxo-4-hydroxy-4-carboxy--5-ureidoimidazoline (OHCU) decarboxylase
VRRALLPIAALAAVLSLLLVAGCGDDEKNAYVDEVNALQTELVQEVSTAAGSTPSNQRQAAEYAGRIAGIFSGAADRFAAVDPPDDVADLHSQLVDQIRSIAADTRKAERTLREGNPEQAQKALKQLQTAATDAQNRLNMLIDEINSDLRD